MKNKFKYIITLYLLLFTLVVKTQNDEIIKLEESNAYQFNEYYPNGYLKESFGFYCKTPYTSIEILKEKQSKNKVKYHGVKRKYYDNGQLKEEEHFKKGNKKGKTKEYFEDGEELAIPAEILPEFNFPIIDQNSWLKNRVYEIERKYKIDLTGVGLIILEISKDASIKSVKVKATNKIYEKYILEIANQIKVLKPAIDRGKKIGTRFSFFVEL